jgi:hypothetical protein
MNKNIAKKCLEKIYLCQNGFCRHLCSSKGFLGYKEVEKTTKFLIQNEYGHRQGGQCVACGPFLPHRGNYNDLLSFFE